jgi:hypothetical protein
MQHVTYAAYMRPLRKPPLGETSVEASTIAKAREAPRWSSSRGGLVTRLD